MDATQISIIPTDMENVLRYVGKYRSKWLGRYDPEVDWGDVYDYIKFMYPNDADAYVAITVGDFSPSLSTIELAFPIINNSLWIDGKFFVKYQCLAAIKVPNLIIFRYDYSPITLKTGTLLELIRKLSQLSMQQGGFTAYIQWQTEDYLFLNTVDRFGPPSEPDTPPDTPPDGEYEYDEYQPPRENADESRYYF